MTQRIKNNSKLWVIVAAAGVGARFGSVLPKQYAVMSNQKTILDTTLSALLQHSAIGNIMLVLHPDDQQWPQSEFYQSERIQTTVGATLRAQSVLNGVLALNNTLADNDWVLTHDVCRPYVSHQHPNQLLTLIDSDHPVGGLLAVPLTDTIKQVDHNSCVIKTVPRDHLWRAQTPQLFRYGLLKKALQAAFAADFIVTDESSAIEFLGLQPVVIQDSTRNIKITYAEDL